MKETNRKLLPADRQSGRPRKKPRALAQEIHHALRSVLFLGGLRRHGEDQPVPGACQRDVERPRGVALLVRTPRLGKDRLLLRRCEARQPAKSGVAEDIIEI
jgi:hypothetical protein